MPLREEPLGLPRGRALVREYDPRWASEFDMAAGALRVALGDSVQGIEHVGSTAVPGLPAKPVLDIAIGLPDGSTLGDVQSALEAAGYEYRGDLGDEGGLIFAKGTESARTHYLHVVAAASNQWRNYIVFREALRRHPELRDRYATLKKDLASRFPLDRPSYIAGKAEFITETIAFYRDRIAVTDP
jgi:GrpB-like predicted nucleotidyltransferase (UPF0157 family)